MLRLTRYICLTTIGGLLAAAIFVQAAAAQQASRLSVSPVTFELNADPGDTLTNQVKVTNLSDAELQLETRVENIAGTGQQGQVKLTEESTTYSLSTWVTTTPARFTVKAKQSQTIDFTIKVPANAEPGGHYGSLLVGTIASDKPDGTGAAVAQRIGSLLLVKVSGNAKEQARLSHFIAKSFTGETEESTTPDGKTKVIVPKNRTSLGAKGDLYIQKGPVAFDIMLENSGNVHFRPAGFVTISNIFGKKVAELPIEQRNVFPGSERQLTVVWPKANLWGGFYKAQLLAVYGSNNQQLTADTSFWAFPLTAAIAIVVVLLILIFARRRIAKVIKVLVKG